MYGRLGANVVVNDVSEKGANAVVNEVIQGWRKGCRCYLFCGRWGQIALEKFGGVHVLVANAGVLRDKSFLTMTEQEWDIVLAIHLR